MNLKVNVVYIERNRNVSGTMCSRCHRSLIGHTNNGFWQLSLSNTLRKLFKGKPKLTDLVRETFIYHKGKVFKLVGSPPEWIECKHH
jgi:hypothetical protein